MQYEKLAEELFFFFIRLARLPMDRNFYDMTRGEMGILIYLRFVKDGVSAGALSEFFKISTGRIASILKSLERKRLIKRCEDSLDKRKIHVCITEDGIDVVETRYKNRVKNMAVVLRRLGEEDSRELVRLLSAAIEVCEGDLVCTIR